MEFPKNYKVLDNNSFSKNAFSLVPIRFDDRFKIMQWRNQQIYHLRQAKPLTEEDQNHYFENVVAKLFEQDQPNQILFSFLENDECIGYGGLVHINWVDKNAEISFIMDTKLEEEHFQLHWITYLGLITQLAFVELGLHKIYIYAFDLRPNLYLAAECADFKRDAVLKEHCLFQGEYKDVVIYAKIHKK